MKKALLVLSALFLLVVFMVGTTVSVSAADETQSGTWGYLSWILNETTGELVISGEGDMNPFIEHTGELKQWRVYQSSIKTVIIQEGVTSIGDRAFAGCTALTDVVIPQGVTRIGEFAFSSCESLNSVELPDSLKQMGYLVFSGCHSLTSIVIPDGVTEIPQGAFRFCSSLTNVTIPNSVTKIGSYAFSTCVELRDVVIPDGVIEIDNAAFLYCRNLTSVTIGKGLQSIHSDAFGEVERIKSVTIPTIAISALKSKSLETVVIIGGERIEDGAFSSCTNITSIVIFDGVKSIGRSAFASCESLERLVIPNSVKRIGGAAFERCYNLKNIIYIGTEAEWKAISSGVLVRGTVTFHADHTWDKGVIMVAPTTESEGVKIYTCAVCNETKTERVPMETVSDAPSDGKSTDSNSQSTDNAGGCAAVLSGGVAVFLLIGGAVCIATNKKKTD